MIDAPPGLAELVIANARRYATGKSLETDGPNDGPLIRPWLRRWGVARPAPWCSCFACCQVFEAAQSLGVTLHLKGSAGGLRLLDLNPDLILGDPEPGCLVVFDHGKGLSHVLICASVVRVDGVVAGADMISGNTSADGISRNGDRVAERPYALPDERIAGYVRVA